MENDFKIFLGDWRDAIRAMTEARSFQELQDCWEHKSALEDDFAANFLDYLQSAKEQYCFDDFENLIAEYPELNFYEYAGIYQPHDDDDILNDIF